jgi:cobalamin biosynthesis protein CobT
MVKTKNNISGDIDPPKRRGRVTGAKTYNKQTLFKLVQQYKPVNMVLWGTIAEQYRVACGELEARSAPIIKKFFVQKMCNNMRKPTGSSGIDDFTAKCQSLNRNLYQIEEGEAFGDENDEDPDFQDDHISSDSESDAGDNETDGMAEDDDPINTPTVEVSKAKNSFIPASTDSSSTKLSMTLPKSDTKSKNAKPNPTSRLNVGKFMTLLYNNNYNIV